MRVFVVAVVATFLSLVTVQTAAAQLVAPMPRDSNHPRLTVWGQGKTQSAESEANPFDAASGKLIVTFPMFHETLRWYLSGNKGAGTEAESADDLSLRSLAFPEVGNGAFLGKVHWTALTREHELHSKDYTLTVGPFIDYAWQSRTVTIEDPMDTTSTLDERFDVSHFNFGVGVAGTSHEGDGPLRFSLQLAYTSLQVTDSTVDSYRLIVGDPGQEDVFDGISAKVALQYNDFGFELGYVDLKADDGNEVEGLTGGLLSLAFTATGKVFDVD